MCIISLKPADLVLEEQVINNMWHANSDGAGFMYAEDNVLHVRKGLMTLAEFKEAYEPHKHKKMVLHFRIKTHGETNAANTHPFNVDDNLAFVHNGVISGYGSTEFSDTYHFNKELIHPLRKQFQHFLNVNPITTLLSARIGYSKLVFLSNKGEHVIINEDKGEFSQDGVWFSNSSWKRAASNWKSGYHGTQPVFPFDSYNNTELKKNSGTDPSARGTSNTSRTKDYKRPLYEVGTAVWINQSYKDVPKGAVGKIAWFTSGYLTAVHFSDSEAKYIPAAYLEAVIPLVMTKRVGHLKVGDQLIYDYSEDGMAHVFDSINKKWYYIPEDSFDIETDTDWEYNLMPADLL